VTKELTEYGDRACKAERERDIAIRGNGEAHYKLAASQQRIRELEAAARGKECDDQMARIERENECKQCMDRHITTVRLVDAKNSELEQQNRKLREENSRFRELIERNLDVLEIGPRAALQEPVSSNITEHIGDATGMIVMSPKPTSGTCQSVPSDLLKQCFEEAGVDVDFVDCTPEKERE
jgi:hypothetical protein